VDITYSFMIPLMELFAKATHSYGWSIILLTLLVRLCVWPLVASSTKSMKRMATLQPKLKQLQEKYKDDPETFRQKSMEFYSTNKMNPLGGCLPTLVQFPILIALFATFTGPPFQDKDIPVKVNLAKPADASNVKIVNNPTSGATSPYVSADGKRA
jgi:YidC/Oxa1 family membrane protein insertase